MQSDDISNPMDETQNDEGGKKSILPKIMILTAIISMITLTFLMLWGGRHEMRTVKPGFSAPDFSFRDLNHKNISLSDYRGKIVLLNLWSINCPPCVEEIPYLEKMYQTLKDNDKFHLLTVVTNRGEDETVVRPFVERMGINFHVLIDTKKVAYRRYKITGWPETFLLDKSGKILEKYIGPQDWSSPAFINKINQLTKSPV